MTQTTDEAMHDAFGTLSEEEDEEEEGQEQDRVRRTRSVAAYQLQFLSYF
jgi:hypothetical protein